ncbi:MAG: hypothetical protein ACOCQG_02670 [Candidatus Nanoarchaeia archaeon]
MVSKVRDMINSINEDELQKLYTDLSKGGNHLKKLVSEKLQELEESKTNFCVTCGKGLGDHNASFSLVFGKNGLRKKACFCELDCLEYFVSELKKMREKNIGKEADKYELQGNNKNL